MYGWLVLLLNTSCWPYHLNTRHWGVSDPSLGIFGPDFGRFGHFLVLILVVLGYVSKTMKKVQILVRILNGRLNSEHLDTLLKFVVGYLGPNVLFSKGE